MYNISLNSDWASLEQKKQDPNIQLDRIREAVQKRQRSTSPGGHSSGPPGARTRTLQPEQRQNGVIRSSPVTSPNRMRNSSSKKLELGDKESPRENDMALCTTVDEVFAKIREKRLAALNQSERLSKLPDEKEYDRAFRTTSRDDIYQPLEYKQIYQTEKRGPADLVVEQPNPDRLKYLKTIEKQARSGKKSFGNDSYSPHSTKRSDANGISTVAPQNSFALQEKVKSSGLPPQNSSAYADLVESQVIPYRDQPLRSPPRSKDSLNHSMGDVNIDEVEIVKSNRKPRNDSIGKPRAGSRDSKRSLEEREAGWVSNLNSKRGQPPKSKSKPQKATKGTSTKKELGEDEVMATFKAIRKQYQQQEEQKQKPKLKPEPVIQQEMSMDLPRKMQKVRDSDVDAEEEDIDYAYEKSLSPERSTERRAAPAVTENKKVQVEPQRRVNAHRPIMDDDDIVESYSIARGNNPRVEEIPFYRDLAPYARESAKDRNGETYRQGSSGYNSAIQGEDDPYIDPKNLSSHDILRIVSGKISSQSLRRNFEYPDKPNQARPSHKNYNNRQTSPLRSTPTNSKYYRTPPKYLPPPQSQMHGLTSPTIQKQSVSGYTPQIQTEGVMQGGPHSQAISYTSIYPHPPVHIPYTHKSQSRSPQLERVERNVSPNNREYKDYRERSPLQARAQLISKMTHEEREGDSEELVLIVKLVKEIENLKKAKADAEILPSLPSPERLRNEFSKKIEANLNKLLYTIAGEHSRNKSLKDVVNDLVASAHRFERKVYGPYRKNDLLVYALQEYKTLKDEKLRLRVITNECNKRGISPRRGDDMPHWGSVKNNYIIDNQYSSSNYAEPGSQYGSTGVRYSSKVPGSSSTSPIRGGKGVYASTSKMSGSPYVKKKKEPENDEEGWINTYN